MSEMIKVEVAYALPEKQRIEKLSVAKGTTALEAVKQPIWDAFLIVRRTL